MNFAPNLSFFYRGDDGFLVVSVAPGSLDPSLRSPIGPVDPTPDRVNGDGPGVVKAAGDEHSAR